MSTTRVSAVAKIYANYFCLIRPLWSKRLEQSHFSLYDQVPLAFNTSDVVYVAHMYTYTHTHTPHSANGVISNAVNCSLDVPSSLPSFAAHLILRISSCRHCHMYMTHITLAHTSLHMEHFVNILCNIAFIVTIFCNCAL